MKRTRRPREAASAGTKNAPPKYRDSSVAAPRRELSLDNAMEDMRAILFIDRRDQECSESSSVSKSHARK